MMKEKIKSFGDFNGWRGCMALYFNSKALRTLKVWYYSRYYIGRCVQYIKHIINYI